MYRLPIFGAPLVGSNMRRFATDVCGVLHQLLDFGRLRLASSGQGIPVPHYGARGTCTGLKGTSAGANVTFWKHNCSRALKDVNIVSADENGPNVIFGATAALSSVPERN